MIGEKCVLVNNGVNSTLYDGNLIERVDPIPFEKTLSIWYSTSRR